MCIPEIDLMCIQLQNGICLGIAEEKCHYDKLLEAAQWLTNGYLIGKISKLAIDYC